MALTSASRSWAVIARRALGASAVAALAVVALAVPASAHTGKPVAKCDEETGKTSIKVHLTQYQVKHGNATPNTVKVLDGDTVLDQKSFGANYDFEKLDLPGDVTHNFKVEVRAWDDTDLKHAPDWSFDWVKEVKPCKQPPSSSSSAPPSSSSSVTQPPSSSSSSSSAAPTTTTTPAAVGASANLADTGASIAIPLTIGALLLVGGAAMLLILRKRKA